MQHTHTHIHTHLHTQIHTCRAAREDKVEHARGHATHIHLVKQVEHTRTSTHPHTRTHTHTHARTHTHMYVQTITDPHLRRAARANQAGRVLT